MRIENMGTIRWFLSILKIPFKWKGYCRCYWHWCFNYCCCCKYTDRCNSYDRCLCFSFYLCSWCYCWVRRGWHWRSEYHIDYYDHEDNWVTTNTEDAVLSENISTSFSSSSSSHFSSTFVSSPSETNSSCIVREEQNSGQSSDSDIEIFHTVAKKRCWVGKTRKWMNTLEDV